MSSHGTSLLLLFQSWAKRDPIIEGLATPLRLWNSVPPRARDAGFVSTYPPDPKKDFFLTLETEYSQDPERVLGHPRAHGLRPCGPAAPRPRRLRLLRQLRFETALRRGVSRLWPWTSDLCGAEVSTCVCAPFLGTPPKKEVFFFALGFPLNQSQEGEKRRFFRGGWGLIGMGFDFSVLRVRGCLP